MRRCGLQVIAGLLTAAMLAASTPAAGASDGQSVTVGASWLQRQRTDVMDEVVHSADDDDDQTTTTTTAQSHHTRSVSMHC